MFRIVRTNGTIGSSLEGGYAQGTEKGVSNCLDLGDAGFVANRSGITGEQVRGGGEATLATSPQDTALFLFRKMVELFCTSLARIPR